MNGSFQIGPFCWISSQLPKEEIPFASFVHIVENASTLVDQEECGLTESHALPEHAVGQLLASLSSPFFKPVVVISFFLDRSEAYTKKCRNTLPKHHSDCLVSPTWRFSGVRLNGITSSTSLDSPTCRLILQADKSAVHCNPVTVDRVSVFKSHRQRAPLGFDASVRDGTFLHLHRQHCRNGTRSLRISPKVAFHHIESKTNISNARGCFSGLRRAPAVKICRGACGSWLRKEMDCGCADGCFCCTPLPILCAVLISKFSKVFPWIENPSFVVDVEKIKILGLWHFSRCRQVCSV